MRTPNMRSQNVNFRRNVNNNVRMNANTKGKQVERLNKTFVREGKITRTKAWVEKKKDTSKNKMKLVIVTENPLST